ncbi:MAG: flotillin-like FloA family protein [Verrucomicrobia bacterium]|nr:flotillin-like FloA family protein [Verrucomicrobiota bacterium]
MATGVVVLFYVGGLMALILFGVVLVFFKTWIRALAAGVGVSFGTLIGMRLRNVPAGRIVEALITVHKAGMSDVTIEILERHHLAGGNVTRVARALAAARVAGIDLTFEHAAAIDLDGRDVFAEVQQAAGTIPTLEA